MNINIDSYEELIVLHKMIMNVKFDEVSCYPEAQGSPYSGRLARKVFSLIIEFEKEQGNVGKADEWLRWQKADSSRFETKLLLSAIGRFTHWSALSQIERQEFVVDFMSPLVLSREYLGLVCSVESSE